MLIENIKLKFGSSAGQKPLEIKRPKFTVFVGPNNSGKSQILRDIQNFCRAGDKNNSVILGDVRFKAYEKEEIEKIVNNEISKPRQGENISEGHEVFSIAGKRVQIPIGRLRHALASPHENGNTVKWYAGYHASHYTANLSGVNRITLLNDQGRGDLKSPNTTFARLFVDDVSRHEVRQRIHDAVGMYFGLDAFNSDKIGIRFASSLPPNERSYEETTRQWMINSKAVQQVSDGVKAFTGIMIELAAGEPKVIVIDEPEAFLHPALAYKLGKEIAKSSISDNKQIFVATHSPQFLMGAIQSGAEVSIVRLTYSNDVGSARILPTENVQTLMQDPLLRSANVLSGLFHEYVIVTEADADRAFYQEINERLNDGKGFSGIPNALFLNSNGKDTLHRIAKPLRELGVPVAAIADVDVLAQGGANWTNHLEGYFVPPLQHQVLGVHRKSVWDALTAKSTEPKRNGGLDLLSGEELELSKNLLETLEGYGFFIVDVGEVEHWLPELGVPTGKQSWLRSIFEAMGHDPSAQGYLKPGKGDVWAFLGRIRSWLLEDAKKGIPK